MNFSSYYSDGFVRDEEYRIRFSVPCGWEVDVENAEELGLVTILTDGGDFNDADVFVSVRMNFSDKNAERNIEEILLELEDIYLESGYEKDHYLSSLKLYDNRPHVVVAIKDTEVGYIRRDLLVPLAEAPEMLLVLGFQVNHDSDEFFHEKLNIFVSLIESFKITPTEIDEKEKEHYLKDLVQKQTEQDLSEVPIIKRSVESDV